MFIFLVLRRWPRALLLVLELWSGQQSSTPVRPSQWDHTPLGFYLSRLPRRGQRSVYIRPVLRWCCPRTSTGSGLGSHSATPLSDFWCLVLVRGPFPGPEFLKPVGAGCCVLHVCLSWASWIPVRSSRGVNGTPSSHCASGASAGLFLSPEESGFVAIGQRWFRCHGFPIRSDCPLPYARVPAYRISSLGSPNGDCVRLEQRKTRLMPGQ